VDLLSKIHREDTKVSPLVKETTKVGMYDFNETKEHISEALTFKSSPGKFMKYMDTGIEKFFYQRDYTLENFNFYLQVLSSQYKGDEAEEVIQKMKILGIKPDYETYTQLIAVSAKLKNVERVEQLIEQGMTFF